MGLRKTAERSRIKTVRLSQLVTGTLANREVRKPFVEYLVKNWDSAGLGIPRVAADGTDPSGESRYFVIDGQHRVEALKLMTVDDLRIEVEELDSPEEQDRAHDFLVSNKKLNIVAFERFRIALLAGEAEETAINAILESQGYHLATGEARGALSCTSAMLRIFRMDKLGAVLRRTLHLSKSAWGLENPYARHGNLLLGIALLIDRYPDIDISRLQHKLSTVPGADSLLGAGRTIRELQGGTVASGIGEALRLEYNKGLRKNLLG